MTWDANSKKLAIKTIGTVESNMKYDSIYYADPITIGIMQWYAGRAVNILNQLKTNALYSAIDASLRNDLTAHPDPDRDWSWWSNRYLTKSEGSSLKPLLASSQGVQVQNAQTLTDLAAYEVTAKAAGLDPETNTNAFIFWCVMHHQSPRQAKLILNSAGGSSSLDRLYSYAMNNAVFSKYKSRYQTAKTIILSGDSSGVPDFGVDPTPDEEGGDDGADVEIDGNINYLEIVGNCIHVHTKTGVLVCYPTGGNLFLPNKFSESNGAGPGIVVDPITPPPGTPSEKLVEVVKWMTDRIGRFRYSQGAGRLDPDKSGVGDCSSTVRRAYLDKAGVTLNGNTRSQQKDGRVVWDNEKGPHNIQVPESVLQLGDLIYYKRGPGRQVSHVEMYKGNGEIIGHGGGPNGTRNGPTIASLSSTKSCYTLIVRRIL